MAAYWQRFTCPGSENCRQSGIWGKTNRIIKKDWKIENGKRDGWNEKKKKKIIRLNISWHWYSVANYSCYSMKFNEMKTTLCLTITLHSPLQFFSFLFCCCCCFFPLFIISWWSSKQSEKWMSLLNCVLLDSTVVRT